MFITMRDGIREYMLRLDDIESFASKEGYRTGCELFIYLKNREDSRDFMSFTHMLVHDENGELTYEKVEDLQHLMKLIEKEKDYLARKELF